MLGWIRGFGRRGRVASWYFLRLLLKLANGGFYVRR
nr:MAG TPA: hypothetical protein [Caudoviricetes sp.]